MRDCLHPRCRLTSLQGVSGLQAPHRRSLVRRMGRWLTHPSAERTAIVFDKPGASGGLRLFVNINGAWISGPVLSTLRYRYYEEGLADIPAW